MTTRKALAVVAILAAVMVVQAVVLTFWCESASVFSFRVEDLTFQPKRVFPIGEFKATIPGGLDFAAVLGLALLARGGRTLRVLGVSLEPRHQLLFIVLLTGWNLGFAAFLVVLEVHYLTPCPL